MKQLFLFLLLPAYLVAQDKATTPLHYPQIQTTGDAKTDETNWIKAKNEWIENHPEEYKAFSGSTQAMPTIPVETKSEKSQLQSAFETRKTYKLVGVEAVPTNNHKAAKDEISAETKNMQQDFLVGTELLQIGNNNQIRLFVQGKKDLRATQKREGNTISWLFVKEGCEKCNKTLSLHIEEEQTDKLVYILQSEDEDAKFATRLIYSLSNN